MNFRRCTVRVFRAVTKNQSETRDANIVYSLKCHVSFFIYIFNEEKILSRILGIKFFFQFKKNSQRFLWILGKKSVSLIKGDYFFYASKGKVENWYFLLYFIFVFCILDCNTKRKRCWIIPPLHSMKSVIERPKFVAFRFGSIFSLLHC